MKQNKYDEAGFFQNYSQMPRSTGGLEAAGEWAAFRALLPDLEGHRVLDLGSGFGWHCRYAREQGAASVVGIDLSANMLERARAMTSDPEIEYLQLAMEDANFAAEEFDTVISSLAIHYIEQFGPLCRQVQHCLKRGGAFVFSVEHPIYTALAGQDWHYSPEGGKQHWPVDHYHVEGARQADFLGHKVTKYHRNTATYINTLLDSGFSLKAVSELQPTPDMLAANAAWQEETRRPMFLLLSAVKGEA